MIKEILDRIDENTWIISDTHIGHGKEGTGILSFEPCRLTQMRIDGYNADEHDQWIIDNWNDTVKPGDTVLHLGDFAFKPGYYTKEFDTCYEEKYKNVSYKELKARLKLTNSKTLEEISKFLIAETSLDGMNKEQFKSLISNYIPENEYYIRFKDLLNGNIILVLGNHDPKPFDNKLQGFDVINGFYHFTGDILNKVQHPDPMFSGFIKEIGGTKYLFTHYDIFTTDSWDLKNKMIAPRINVLKTIFEAFDCDNLVHGHVHSLHSAREKDINVCFEHLGFKPKKLSTLIK